MLHFAKRQPMLSTLRARTLSLALSLSHHMLAIRACMWGSGCFRMCQEHHELQTRARKAFM